jgi:hypothetical protein
MQGACAECLSTNLTHMRDFAGRCAAHPMGIEGDHSKRSSAQIRELNLVARAACMD